MNIEEILKAIQGLSPTDATKVFTTIADKFDDLPKALEEKYLSRKNEKLSEKDEMIKTLQDEVEIFKKEDAKRAQDKVEKDISNAITANKVNTISQKDFMRAVRSELSNEENKEKSFDDVVKSVLSENKHYTQEIKPSGEVVIENGEETKTNEVNSSAQLLHNAQNKTN